MTNNDELALHETEQLEIYYVQIPEGKQYKSTEAYPLVPASDIQQDGKLQKQKLTITTLSFFAGDLPDEDSWDANLLQLFNKFVKKRFSKDVDRLKRQNEAFLRVQVSHVGWSIKRDDDGDNEPEIETNHISQGFQFKIMDNRFAGGLADRSLFRGIEIQNSLDLRIELQELDEIDKEASHISDILKEAGLDDALQLDKLPVVNTISNVVRAVANLNQSEIIWDNPFTLTLADTLGQAKLRTGIYVVMQKLPDKFMDNAGVIQSVYDQFDPSHLRFKNRMVFYDYDQLPNNGSKLSGLQHWNLSYFAFTIGLTQAIDLTWFKKGIESYRSEWGDDVYAQVASSLDEWDTDDFFGQQTPSFAEEDVKIGDVTEHHDNQS